MTPTRWQPPRPPAAPRTVLITPRMADVLAGVCRGQSNAEIGRRLFIAEDTVKTHLRKLFRLLGARDRAHAAVLACTGQVELIVHGYDSQRSAA